MITEHVNDVMEGLLIVSETVNPEVTTVVTRVDGVVNGDEVGSTRPTVLNPTNRTREATTTVSYTTTQ